jgi:hypothetical protein
MGKALEDQPGKLQRKRYSNCGGQSIIFRTLFSEQKSNEDTRELLEDGFPTATGSKNKATLRRPHSDQYFLPTVDNLRNFFLTTTTEVLSFFQQLREAP